MICKLALQKANPFDFENLTWQRALHQLGRIDSNLLLNNILSKRQADLIRIFYLFALGGPAVKVLVLHIGLVIFFQPFLVFNSRNIAFLLIFSEFPQFCYFRNIYLDVIVVLVIPSLSILIRYRACQNLLADY